MSEFVSATWADAAAGDCVLIKGVEWRITAATGDAKGARSITMVPIAGGPARHGQPVPTWGIQLCKRSPADMGEHDVPTELVEAEPGEDAYTGNPTYAEVITPESPVDREAAIAAMRAAAAVASTLVVAQEIGQAFDSMIKILQVQIEPAMEDLRSTAVAALTELAQTVTENAVQLANGEPVTGDHSLERAAYVALHNGGLNPEVIERVMSLGDLKEHLSQKHGDGWPAAPASLVTLYEYRTELLDWHFEAHQRDQGFDLHREPANWQPRGEQPHVHPVFDRPAGPTAA